MAVAIAKQAGVQYIPEHLQERTIVRHDGPYSRPEVDALVLTLPRNAQRLLAHPLRGPGWLWAFQWRSTYMDGDKVVVGRRLAVRVGALVDGEQFEVEAQWDEDGRYAWGWLRRGRGRREHGWKIAGLIEAVEETASDAELAESFPPAVLGR